MIDGTRALTVLPLGRTDLVGLAQCMAIDADVFPYSSIPLGLQAGVHIWVARADDGARVVGFVAASARALSFYVHGLAVTPSDRRRGTGRALLDACVAGARGHRLSRVVLHVGTGNQAAVALYEAAGFVVRRQVVDFYRAGVYAERGAYEMVLALG
ncbi:MAG: GNAT family N-acetyltransferase [Polyangiaceae bacterium]